MGDSLFFIILTYEFNMIFLRLNEVQAHICLRCRFVNRLEIIPGRLRCAPRLPHQKRRQFAPFHRNSARR